MERLRLDLIRLDGGTQSRAEVNLGAVDDYAAALEAGAVLPPVTVFYDGAAYWMADGFHRYRAHTKIDWREIDADVQQGTQQDAQWYSLGANQTHGLRRTRADVERAIKTALRLKPDQNNRQISLHIGCSDNTVRKFREEMEASSQIAKIESREVTRGGKTYTQAVGNIGKRPSADTPVTAPRPVMPEPIWPAHDPETGEILEELAAVTAPAFNLPESIPTEVYDAGQRTAPQTTAYTAMQDALSGAGESPRAQELQRVLSRLLEFERDGLELLTTPYAAQMGIQRLAREAHDLLSQWAGGQPERHGKPIITLDAN